APPEEEKLAEQEILVNMAGNDQKPLRDYAMPNVTDIQSSIRRPAINANTFEIKPATIQMLQNQCQFGGSSLDDPNEHILSFLEVCDTFKFNNVSEDAIRLRMFPFTLKDKARSWLHSQPSDSILTWDDLAQKFLAKFFPPAKSAKLRNDIHTFAQFDSESLYEAWERFKDMLRKCPHHGIPQWMQLGIFCDGLQASTRASIDAAAGGAIMSKNLDEAYKLLETMATNNYQWPMTRNNPPKTSGKYDVDAITSLQVQMTAMAKQIELLRPQSTQQVAMVCEICAGGYTTDQCAINTEAAHYVGSYSQSTQPYPNQNAYNPGWKNHPGFSWSNNQAAEQAPKQQNNSGFQNQTQQPVRKASWEEALERFVKATEKKSEESDKRFNQMELSIQSQHALIKNMENQMGQMAHALNSRSLGTLPSDTEKNPGRDEHCKAVTLQSGKELQEFVTKKEKDDKASIETDEVVETEKRQYETLQQKNSEPTSTMPPIPYPQRFQKSKLDKQFSRFLDIFKKLHINIPFAE
ncbi:MAG TPA: hypothetical protein VF487_00055, partial [Chitinophagaceae bacterium]